MCSSDLASSMRWRMPGAESASSYSDSMLAVPRSSAMTSTFVSGDAQARTSLRTCSTSVSPVTVFRSLAGPGMQDLLALLEAGDGEAVVHHLVGAHAADCDAHCPACDRGYCRPHAAIEDS